MSVEDIADAIRSLDIKEDMSADKRMHVDAMEHLSNAVEMLAWCTLAAKCLPATKQSPETVAKVVTEIRMELACERRWT